MQALTKWISKPTASQFRRGLYHTELRFYHLNPLKFGEVQENVL